MPDILSMAKGKAPGRVPTKITIICYYRGWKRGIFLDVTTWILICHDVEPEIRRT